MKTIIRWMIMGYRKFLNPVLHALGGPLMGCRFRPTCSQYFLDAVESHGVSKGVCLGIWRILRCNPWSRGGDDPVPPAGEWRNRSGEQDREG